MSNVPGTRRQVAESNRPTWPADERDAKIAERNVFSVMFKVELFDTERNICLKDIRRFVKLHVLFFMNIFGRRHAPRGDPLARCSQWRDRQSFKGSTLILGVVFLLVLSFWLPLFRSR